MNYNEVNIYDFLLKYKNKKLIYIPNPGNGGDALIAFGTFKVFNDIGLDLQIGNFNCKYNNEILIYSGGGNFTDKYSDCKKFISNNQDNNKIIILPHTINSVDDNIKNLNDNTIIICREKYSYDYVNNLIKNKNNLYLSKDMAFYISKDFLEKFNKKNTNKTFNCFRLDSEKTNITIPNDNNDLSQTIQHMIPNSNCYTNTSNIYIVNQITINFFEILSNFETINTNRLHVAIAGCLLGKTVNLYSNCYWKNKAIYEYSIQNIFTTCKFIN